MHLVYISIDKVICWIQLLNNFHSLTEQHHCMLYCTDNYSATPLVFLLDICGKFWFFLLKSDTLAVAAYSLADQNGTNNVRYQHSLQNNKKGVERWRARSSLRGWQTDSEPAGPLSSDRHMSPLSAWPSADQGRARRLLKWRNLRAPRGVSWSFDVQHKGRVWCWMSWGREAASAVCCKGLVWWLETQGKILSTDSTFLYFLHFVWKHLYNPGLLCGLSENI